MRIVKPALIALSLAMTACSRGPAQRPMAGYAVEAKRAIAQPCVLPPAQPSASGETRVPRVFVEIAALETDSGERWVPSTLDWRDDPRLGLTHVAHLMTTNDVAATIPWDEGNVSPEAACAGTNRADLSVTSHVPADGVGPLRLDIRIEPAPPLGQSKETWHVPEHRTTRTTVVVQDQQLIVFARVPEANKKPRIMIVMPYVVRDDGDMRRLFECKMQRATLARQHASATGALP
ncbi:MAG TPA: hypothetical protein VK550_10800 [Polyangiaceae bacterium]|nr:hypothetical protein [Polyangiaceae bacterium]